MEQQETIDALLEQLLDPEEKEAHQISKKLAEIGGTYLKNKLIPLFSHENQEVVYLAAQTACKIDDNQDMLEPLLQAIHEPVNKDKNGALIEALSGFDISDQFIEIFKLYLFGNFKAAAMAKLLLDYEEFDVVPRTIRKCEKHLKHFEHNMPNSAQAEVKLFEAKEILSELKEMFE